MYTEDVSPLVEECHLSSRCFSKGDSSGKFGKSAQLSWSQCLIWRNLKWLFCGKLNLDDSCWKLDSMLLLYVANSFDHSPGPFLWSSICDRVRILALFHKGVSLSNEISSPNNAWVSCHARKVLEIIAFFVIKGRFFFDPKKGRFFNGVAFNICCSIESHLMSLLSECNQVEWVEMPNSSI